MTCKVDRILMGGKRGDVKVLLGGGGGVNFVHVAVSWQLAECCPRNVQTFFCWKCRSGLRCVPRLRRYGHVSILLLLEMPQWRTGMISGGIITAAFQSFFYWKCRNGMIVPNANNVSLEVSILLLLEMPQWHDPLAIASHAVNQFQSFFYWKCRNGFGPVLFLLCVYCGFNPSFTGNAAMAGRIFIELPMRNTVSILLLLEMPQWHVVRPEQTK